MRERSSMRPCASYSRDFAGSRLQAEARTCGGSENLSLAAELMLTAHGAPGDRAALERANS